MRIPIDVCTPPPPIVVTLPQPNNKKRPSYIARIRPSAESDKSGWFERDFLPRTALSGHFGQIKLSSVTITEDGIYDIFDTTKDRLASRCHLYWRVNQGQIVCESRSPETVILWGMELPELTGLSSKQIDYGDVLRRRFFAKVILAGYQPSQKDLAVTEAREWIAKNKLIMSVVIDSSNDNLPRS